MAKLDPDKIREELARERRTVYVKREVTDQDTGELRMDYVQMDLEDVIRESFRRPGVGKAMLDRRGHEIVNPVPVAPPVGYKREPSLMEQMRTMIQQERQALLDLDPESLDEADDFEVEDDPQPQSPWENDAEPSIKELRRRALEAGYVYNQATGQYEMPPEPPEMSQEGGQGGGFSAPPKAGLPLDGSPGDPQSKKPRGGKSPAASKAPDLLDQE